MKIADSTIAITGGANGIGKFLATSLNKTAKKVIVMDKDHEMLRVMLSHSPEMTIFKCDVGDYEEVQDVFEEIDNQRLLPDILINNAGLIISEPMVNVLQKSSHSQKNWDKAIGTNLTGTFNTTTHWARKLAVLRRPGLVINISSIARNGHSGQSAYSASKAGVHALTQTWAQEFAPFRLRAVAIEPGFTDSVGTTSNVEQFHLDEIVSQTPVRRLGSLSEIESCINFVIENDFVNGTSIEVNGGLRL